MASVTGLSQKAGWCYEPGASGTVSFHSTHKLLKWRAIKHDRENGIFMDLLYDFCNLSKWKIITGAFESLVGFSVSFI